MKPGDLLAAKYRLEHVLGSGGMGEVWAAVNESTGRPVAVKLIQSSTPELRARMLREARAGGTLKHKNIVDVYDVGETEDGDPFLVMERLSGETLADRLERGGRLPPATAVEIAGSIAAALRVAHAKGIIHRDLKPANVFLHREAEGEGEIVKVVDFGVSKHLQDTAGITAGLVGSPAYMSPEQACEDANIDARSDLWSLGVVLFFMLAGRRPFPSSSPYVVITEVVNGPIPSIAAAVPGLSPTLVHVVQRCLTRDVNARVASADELIRLLGSSLDVDPSSEEEPTGRREAMPSSTEPTTKELEDWARRPGSPAAGITAPLVLVGEASATIATGHHSGLGPVPMRGPSNAFVALVAGAAALLLIVVFGGALRRAPPTAERATSAAASTEPPEATNTVVPSSPQPAVAMGETPKPPARPVAMGETPKPPAQPVAMGETPKPPAQPVAIAPEAPARSEPATLPPLGKDEASSAVDAPAATSVSPDGKRIGTVPAAPSAHPQAPLRTHPSGEKRLVLP